MIGALTGLHYSHAWRVHQTMCKAMERVPSKRFVYEVKPAIGNDLQEASEENADEISFETVPFSRFLLQKFSQFKGRVKDAENFLLNDLYKRKTYRQLLIKSFVMFTRKEVSETKSVVAYLASNDRALKLSERDFSQIFLILKAMSLI